MDDAIKDRIDELCAEAEQYYEFGLTAMVPLYDGKSPRVKKWQDKDFSIDDLRAEMARADEPGIGLKLGPASRLIDVEWDNAAQREKAYEIFGSDLLDQCPAFGRPGDPDHQHRLLAWHDGLNAIGKANLYIECEGHTKENPNQLIARIGVGGSQSAIPPSPNKEWQSGRKLLFECAAPRMSDEVVNKLLAYAKPTVAPAETENTQTELRDDEAAIASAVEAMVKATKNMQDGGDGSKRKYVCMERAYDEGLTDAAAIKAFRLYENDRPFAEREYDDANLLDELRRIEMTGRDRKPARTVYTDAFNAELLARQHSDDVRYVYLREII